jgi:hypothetical protein
MLVSQVKDIARQWTIERAASLPDFAGAFFVGSVVHMPDEQEFPTTSDVDLRIVVERDLPDLFNTPRGEFAQRKFVFRDVLLEPIYARRDGFRDPSQILESPRLAVNFSVPNIILDPAGDLQRLYQQVSAAYREACWVKQRCKKAEQVVLPRLEMATGYGQRIPGVASDLLYRISWLYVGAIPVAVQIPRIANLRGITLRKSLVASRKVLGDLGQDDLYERILEVVGVRGITVAEARAYLAELSAAFDYALDVLKTPFYGDFDLQELSRPVVVDGARELIEAGFHREAVFWVLCMRNWIQNAIENDGAEPEKAAFRSGFERLLSTMGLSSLAAVANKAEEVRQLLPKMMSVAQSIIDSHPDIVR